VSGMQIPVLKRLEQGEWTCCSGLVGENGCSWNARICREAAAGGHFELLQWARREQGCSWDAKEVCWRAADSGIVQWGRKQGVCEQGQITIWQHLNCHQCLLAIDTHPLVAIPILHKTGFWMLSFTGWILDVSIYLILISSISYRCPKPWCYQSWSTVEPCMRSCHACLLD
jgi:hypothetical protein